VTDDLLYTQQPQNLKVKHLSKRNGSGHNVENHNPNSVFLQHQHAILDKSSTSEGAKYSHYAHHGGSHVWQQVEHARNVEAPKIIVNNSNPSSKTGTSFTSASNTQIGQRSNGGDKLLRPFNEPSRFTGVSSRDTSDSINSFAMI